MANSERTIERAQLLSAATRLVAERAGLLEQLIGLDERTLTDSPIFDDWMVKDLLAHIAAWDRWEDRTMKCMVAGETPDFTAVQDFDAANAAFVAEWWDRTLAEVLMELQDARSTWVAWLRTLPEAEFFQRRSFQSWDWSFPGCVEIQWRHDAEHAAEIAAWREAEDLRGKTGPKAVLLAALAAVRDELLTAAAQVLPEGRASRPVCGEWTLKDVLGHVADWEWLGVEGLRQMAAGQPLQVGDVEDIDTWNQIHVEVRRDQPWEVVWTDFHAAHEAFIEVLEGMAQTDLDRTYPAPWGAEVTPYTWLCIYLDHDRSHARDVREAMTSVAGSAETPEVAKT